MTEVCGTNVETVEINGRRREQCIQTLAENPKLHLLSFSESYSAQQMLLCFVTDVPPPWNVEYTYGQLCTHPVLLDHLFTAEE